MTSVRLHRPTELLDVEVYTTPDQVAPTFTLLYNYTGMECPTCNANNNILTLRTDWHHYIAWCSCGTVFITDCDNQLWGGVLHQFATPPSD